LSGFTVLALLSQVQVPLTKKRTMEISNNSFSKKDIALSIVGFMSIILFLISTNPRTLSAFFLLVFPILVAATSFVVVRFILNLFTSLSAELIKMVSSVIAVGILLVVLLGSLGQLGFQDLLLAFLLVSGLVFYLKHLQSAREVNY
jgi:hypothetical protein